MESECKEASNTAHHGPQRRHQFLHIAIVSGFCFSWLLIYRNLVPSSHSPIAPSRINHGFGLPKLPRLNGDEVDCSSSTSVHLNRNYTRFNEEYGEYGSGTLNDTMCMKEILIYGTLNKMEDYPELAGILNLFRESVGYSYTAHFVCPNRCAIGLRIGIERAYFVNKDAVIFGMLPKDFVGHLDVLSTIEPLQNQTWIYYSTEPPFRILRWVEDMSLQNIRYHKLMTYHMNSEIPYPFGYFVKYNKSEISRIADREMPNFAANKTRLIAWMVSNCEEVFWSRFMLVENLMEYMHIDIYGRCGNPALRCLPRDSEECNWMLTKYKFYLALANSECRHYITEKVWRISLQHNIIPVIYGAPKVDVERFAPPHSYIHVSDFSSVEDLANYLLLLDKNDALYNAYFEWKIAGRVVSNFPPHPNLFCDILSNTQSITVQNPVAKSKKPCADNMRLKSLGTSPWWRTCRYDVDMTTAVYTRNPKLMALYKKWKPWNVTDDF